MKLGPCLFRLRHLVTARSSSIFPPLGHALHSSAPSASKEDDTKPKWYDPWSSAHVGDEKRLIELGRAKFETAGKRNKASFVAAVRRYDHIQKIQRRGHVEFIRAALAQMNDCGVHRDIAAYKLLLRLFPVGKMVPKSAWQVDMMHYPKQQDCCIELLEQMEVNGVIPDDAMGYQLKAIFGDETHAFRKYRRMMYWLPKFRNANPYYVPYDVPEDETELAIMALKRMAVDLQNEVTVFQASDLESCVDHTFIASAQSPAQRRLIAEHSNEKPVFVEGGCNVWLRGKCLTYFILRSEVTDRYTRFEEYENKEDDESLFNWTSESSSFGIPKPKAVAVAPSEHEQVDGTVLATCITGTSSKDSLLSWIRHLENANPSLVGTPVVFQLRSQEGGIEIWREATPEQQVVPSDRWK